MNRKFVVAMISFFDNEIKQFKVEAENEYEAVKKCAIEFTPEEYKQGEIDFQQSERYPSTLEDLISYYNNGDMDVSVIDVTDF